MTAGASEAELLAAWRARRCCCCGSGAVFASRAGFSGDNVLAVLRASRRAVPKHRRADADWCEACWRRRFTGETNAPDDHHRLRSGDRALSNPRHRHAVGKPPPRLGAA